MSDCARDRGGRRAGQAGSRRERAAGVDEELTRAEDDELTEHLARQEAERFADLLRRLGE